MSTGFRSVTLALVAGCLGPGRFTPRRIWKCGKSWRLSTEGWLRHDGKI